MSEGKNKPFIQKKWVQNKSFQMVALLVMEEFPINVQDQESIELPTVLHALEVH